MLDAKRVDPAVDDFLLRCQESPFSRKLDLWGLLGKYCLLTYRSVLCKYRFWRHHHTGLFSLKLGFSHPLIVQWSSHTLKETTERCVLWVFQPLLKKMLTVLMMVHCAVQMVPGGVLSSTPCWSRPSWKRSVTSVLTATCSLCGWRVSFSFSRSHWIKKIKIQSSPWYNCIGWLGIKDQLTYFNMISAIGEH